MSETGLQTQGGMEGQPVMPVRRLNNYVYCPRLFYFQWVENVFQESADTVAISLINRGELGPEDFIKSANGTFLNDRGRKAFWEAWFRRLDAEVSHPEFSYKMAYRRMLEVQARQLWRFVRGEAAAYHGFTTR